MVDAPCKVDLLDIVCNPTQAIPCAYRLARLHCRNSEGIKVSSRANEITIPQAVISQLDCDVQGVLIAVPDAEHQTTARIEINPGSHVLDIKTGPVTPFEIYLMPSSHLMFGYYTGLPEHIEAARIIAQALDLIESTPDYHFSIEFTRALANFCEKYPHRIDAVRKALESGRLCVSTIWSPANFEYYDSESQIRQLAESQWWLREHFGRISPVAMGCDNSSFDSQQPQIFRQAQVEFFWRCRYTLWGKDYGSPFLEHVGADGTRLPCFVSRPPISSGYLWPPIAGLCYYGDIDYSEEGFGRQANEIAAYLSDSKGICKANCNAHFFATDQGQADVGLPERVSSWNNVYVTPKVTVTAIDQAARKMLDISEFPHDEQEPEQPNWGVCEIAGTRLTLAFQQAAYALATAEKAATLDLFINSTPYPASELKAAWINILNEQNHEQLGHAVLDASEHAEQLVKRATSLAEDISRCAFQRIASHIGFQKKGEPLVVFNMLNWGRRDIVELTSGPKDAVVVDHKGQVVPQETILDGSGQSLRFMAEVDSTGYNTYYLAPAKSNGSLRSVAADLSASDDTIENLFYRLEVDPTTGCVRQL